MTTKPTSIQLIPSPRLWYERLIPGEEHLSGGFPVRDIERQVRDVRRIMLFEREIHLTKPFGDGTVAVYGIQWNETDALLQVLQGFHALGIEWWKKAD